MLCSSTKLQKLFYFLELKTLFPHPSLKTQINTKKIKISKTVQQQGTINNLKYSNHYPNILSSCDEKGFISLIETNIDNNKKIEKQSLIFKVFQAFFTIYKMSLFFFFENNIL